MSNYRTVYDSEKVLTSAANDSNTVTTSNEQFIIDTIENTMDRLALQGIDISYFWKTGLASRKVPSDLSTEVDITNHPDDDSITRKVFVDKLSIDQTKKVLYLICIVRHFDEYGDHITAPYDDQFVSLPADNNEMINYMGEFDYFVDLINNQGANLFTVQTQNITSLDSEGRFNDIY